MVGVLALELVLHLRGGVERGAVLRARIRRAAAVDRRYDDLELGLADLLGELALQRAELLDLAVGDVQRVEDLGFGDLPRAGLDHQDRVLGPGDGQLESLAPSRSSSRGLTTKLPSILPIRTAPTGVASGISEIISAAEAPFIARMS